MRILPKRDRIVQRHDLNLLIVFAFLTMLTQKSSEESDRSHSVRSCMFIEWAGIQVWHSFRSAMRLIIDHLEIRIRLDHVVKASETLHS